MSFDRLGLMTEFQERCHPNHPRRFDRRDLEFYMRGWLTAVDSTAEFLPVTTDQVCEMACRWYQSTFDWVELARFLNREDSTLFEEPTDEERAAFRDDPSLSDLDFAPVRLLDRAASCAA